MQGRVVKCRYWPEPYRYMVLGVSNGNVQLRGIWPTYDGMPEIYWRNAGDVVLAEETEAEVWEKNRSEAKKS